MLSTNEERNELAKALTELPEQERNRIDFNYFSFENFDALDSFCIPYVKVKLDVVIDNLTDPKNFDPEECHMGLFYVVT